MCSDNQGRLGNMMATGIGSLPHMDAREALELVLDRMPALPYWPQLSRQPGENMYWQFLTGMPGLAEGTGGGIPRIADQEAFWSGLEHLIAHYVAVSESSTSEDGGARDSGAAGDGDPGLLPPERAATLWLLPEYRSQLRRAVAIKGQVTGPVSMGLSVLGPEGRPALYEPQVMEAITALLYLKVRWQEEFLRHLHPCTLVFLDEPYLGTLGSGFYAYEPSQVRGWLGQVLAGARGWTGIHCCANTDWELLLGVGVDVISFDAYSYFENLAIYADEIGKYLDRGGILAWGIVPASGAHLRQESPATLVERWLDYAGQLQAKGVAFRQLLEQSLVTPSCGLGSLSETEAEVALDMCGQVSSLIRSRYGLAAG